MRVERIAAHESRFDQSGEDSNGKFHHLIKRTISIPGTPDRMSYTQVRPASGDESYYYKTQVQKDQIVIHFTMGYLKGDIGILTTADNHVSVAFVIGRNGTIYNLFPSSQWSYHLGPGTIGGNKIRSRASIGIEISNIGPLKAIDQNMVTVYSDNDIYCRNDQHDFYVREDFRSYHHFATFTDRQYDGLIMLLRYLTARYNIPHRFLTVNERYETNNQTPLFRGIVSHINYRRTGKVDIGPAFDWDRLINHIAT